MEITSLFPVIKVVSLEKSIKFVFLMQGLGTLAKKKEKRKVLSHHLFFCMRDFSYHLGEDAEVFFSLYDSQKGKFIR